MHLARDHDAGRVSDLDDGAGVAFWRSVYDGHAARGELEVATLRLDGHLAAYVVALADSPAYRVFDGRFAPKLAAVLPGRRLEVAVVEHARGRVLPRAGLDEQRRPGEAGRQHAGPSRAGPSPRPATAAGRAASPAGGRQRVSWVHRAAAVP